MSLFLRNLFFTILQPGVVAGLIPFLLAKKSFENIVADPFHAHHYVALSKYAGIGITLHCIANFTIHARALSPADPTKRLVFRGFTGFPESEYVGVMLILVGEQFLSDRLIYLCTDRCLHGFHYLSYPGRTASEKRFGKGYHDYCKTVRRWI